jgi:uncharacterized protein (TIGR00251 family)
VTQLSLKVIPGAARAGIVGWLGESLKIKVTAPPEKGKANREVITILSEAINIAPAAISILKGKTAAFKLVEIDNLSTADVKKRINQTLKGKENL